MSSANRATVVGSKWLNLGLDVRWSRASRERRLQRTQALARVRILPISILAVVDASWLSVHSILYVLDLKSIAQ